MAEPQPLPLTPQEFEEWSDRQIAGACITKTDNPEALITSQKFALASMIMHLGPTESHKPDAYFIHSLRKGAANQVAHAVMVKFKEEQKAKEEADKLAKEQFEVLKQEAEAIAQAREEAQEDAARELLENKDVQGTPEAVVPAAIQ